MRKEYDLKKMKLKPNPYINKLKKSVTIRLDIDVIEYFKYRGKIRPISSNFRIYLGLPTS
jgi:uncharacterized protein (DUF4415 family)